MEELNHLYPQPVGADADVDSLVPLDGHLSLQHSHGLWSTLFPAQSNGAGRSCSLCYGYNRSYRSELKLGSLLCSFHCEARSAAFSNKGTSHLEIGDGLRIR